MPAKKLQNKNLVELLEEYWREIVKGIPKTDDSGSATNLKDANTLIYKWKSFSRTLDNFSSEITNLSKANSPKLLHTLFRSKVGQKISVVQMKLSPKTVRERGKINISLTINQETGTANVFLNSKIGLQWHNFTHVSVENIPNLDIDGTLENIRAFTEKYRECKEGAEKIVEQKKLEMEKQRKLAEMASKSIETIVPQLMAQSGYEWNLESEYKNFGTGGVPERYILRIKMKKRRMIEITLNRNNFTNKIPEILNVAKQIEQLLEQAPYAVNIVNYGTDIRWIKGTEYEKE
ncbi:MAG: hypothetical protein IKC23_08785 [Fibrobacter sp.]|nr:hypothetical protein [Fibrobacter sp.]